PRLVSRNTQRLHLALNQTLEPHRMSSYRHPGISREVVTASILLPSIRVPPPPLFYFPLLSSTCNFLRVHSLLLSLTRTFFLERLAFAPPPSDTLVRWAPGIVVQTGAGLPQCSALPQVLMTTRSADKSRCGLSLPLFSPAKVFIWAPVGPPG